jgi:predicted protein tyrosine phosphatase
LGPVVQSENPDNKRRYALRQGYGALPMTERASFTVCFVQSHAERAAHVFHCAGDVNRSRWSALGDDLQVVLSSKRANSRQILRIRPISLRQLLQT